jgi:Ca-activated chloride channel family protein
MQRSFRTALAILPVLAATLNFAQVFTSRVRLVDVSVSVYDGHGKAVDGLLQDSFRILDNGVSQPVVSFESVSGDLTCAILLDTTASMRDAMGSMKNGVMGLLDEMRPGDSAAVFAFSTKLERLQDFTVDKDAARRAVLRTRAGGATALFDAIAQVADEIAQRPGKKAIVLFTDGADNSSRLLAESASRRALIAGVPIYAIAEGDAVHETKLVQQLQLLADKTGGSCHKARTPKEVAKVFSDIQAELKHLYLLTYKPPQESDETKWRTIQVLISGAKDYSIRGKQGYFPN